VAQAERERVANFDPPPAELVTNMASYTTVFLAFPIWGQTAPSATRRLRQALAASENPRLLSSCCPT